MADVARVDIGFQGGQVLAVRVTAEEYDAMRKALAGDASWHELRTQDSEVTLDLSQVVYVRRDTEVDHVGF